MQAVVFERNGGPEVLEFQEAPEPAPAGGRVLVDVEAVGVNFRDVYEREGGGYGSPPPAVIGVEGAGRIHGKGDRVAWVDVPHSYAERVAADPRKLVPVPAYYLAADSYPIQTGDWVLVHAAAGGVGLLLTQIAKQFGANVIATTSTDDKAKLAREAGADEVLGYDGFASRAREITRGEGVAAVYDGVGKTTFYEGLQAIRPTGRMILYGAASGQPEPLKVQSLAGLGSLYVQRPTLQTYTRTAEMLRERASLVLDLVETGKLKVRIGARYPLAEARQAHIDLQARKTTGKILLLP